MSKRTFLVRLIAMTKRPSEELAKTAANYLWGEDGGTKPLTYEEVRQTPRDAKFANLLYSFCVVTVVIETERTQQRLNERLMGLRNQTDPFHSRVVFIELPDIAAQHFWQAQAESPALAVFQLKKFFPWNQRQGGQVTG